MLFGHVYDVYDVYDEVGDDIDDGGDDVGAASDSRRPWP
jgi:hypothetical protein